MKKTSPEKRAAFVRALRFTRVRPFARTLALLAIASLAASGAAAQSLPANAPISDGAPAPVASQPEASPWDRPFAGELSFGIGTPTGMMGASGELRLAPPLAFRVGIGAGPNFDQPQVAAMARLRLPELPALNLGAGLSAGEHGVVCVFCSRSRYPHWDLALWNNYELSLEARTQRGVIFRAFGGAAVLVNRDGYECEGTCNEADERAIPVAVPYFGVALGVAFDA